jgi:hypothetical protein
LPYNEQFNKENKIIKESKVIKKKCSENKIINKIYQLKNVIGSPSSGLLTKSVLNNDLNTTPQIPTTTTTSLESPQTEQPADKIPSAPPATGSATKLVNNVQESAKSLNKKQIDERVNQFF